MVWMSGLFPLTDSRHMRDVSPSGRVLTDKLYGCGTAEGGALLLPPPYGTLSTTLWLSYAPAGPEDETAL